MSTKDIAKTTFNVCLFIFGLEVLLYFISIVLAYFQFDRVLGIFVTYSMIAIIPSLVYILTIFPLSAVLIRNSYSQLKWTSMSILGVIILCFLVESIGINTLGGPSMFKKMMRGLFYFGTLSFLPFNISAWIFFSNKRLKRVHNKQLHSKVNA